MWTDQLWADWAPLYFEHPIVRDTSVNVAYWNLDERKLHEIDGKPAVDDALLRHFHFAGFDPRRPELYANYYDEVRTYSRRVHGRDFPRPPSNPVLTPLLQEYADRLLADGSEELRERRYRYGFSADGRSLGLRERAIYREAVLAAEARGADPPPNPFDASRVQEFERLVDEASSLRSLSPQAQRRLERLRPPGASRSSIARASRRLVPALRFALTGSRPPELDQEARVASDIVGREY